MKLGGSRNQGKSLGMGLEEAWRAGVRIGSPELEKGH